MSTKHLNTRNIFLFASLFFLCSIGSAFATQESFCVINKTKDYGSIGYILSSKITQYAYDAKTDKLFNTSVIADSLETGGTIGYRKTCVSFQQDLKSGLFKYVNKFVIRNKFGKQVATCETEKSDFAPHKVATVEGHDTFKCHVTKSW